MSIKKKFFNIFILFFILFNNSSADGLFSNTNSKKFLKVDEAFQASAEIKPEKKIIINFKIEKNYYLYKDKIKVYVNEKEVKNLIFPKAKTKEDEFFGLSYIYDDDFVISNSNNIVNINSINVLFQGCANQGLCYPPIKRNIFKINEYDKNTFEAKESASEKIYKKLLSNNIITNLLLFIGFGLLLSFTPCVLPMIPILSGLILQSGFQNKKKPFFLSLSYIFGMCFLYFTVGLFFGYSTNVYNIQSAFQNPIYLIAFSIILLILSLSMFGLYEIRIFNIFNNFISKFGYNKNTTSYSGTFFMGFVSALIVGPCVAPPLAGIFIYVSSVNPGPLHTGFLFLSLAIGMSIPLLAYGTFVGKLVPKTGKWMKYVNYFFGVLLIFVALTFIDRIVPIFNIGTNESNLIFKKVNNVSELNRFLSYKDDKITFLDVYADWCIECKLMEKKTFKDKNVEARLKNFRLIKIDVTDNTDQDLELLKYLNIIGPPSYKFFDKDGLEIKGFGIQGYMNPENFLKHLNEIEKN